MSSQAIAFFGVASAMLLALPRRLAPVPLLLGACYMTLAQGIEIASASVPVLRMLVFVGIIRVILRGERLAHGLNPLDRAMALFALASLATAPFHADPVGQLVFCFGLILNTCGIYFLLRVFCQSTDDVLVLSKVTALVLAPVAVEMLLETMTGRNLFAVFGGVPDFPDVRNGRIRAQGPFAHAILGGTVGAVCFPIFVGLFRWSTVASVLGASASVAMVVASASSGPMGSLFASIAALLMWKKRHAMQFVRRAIVVIYIILALVMKVPPYYLLARIDLAGGSTGWHRAELIDSALKHVSEWWVWGTDYTRHWMPTGVSWSPDHTDITNHYIQLGVIGGFPLMFLFIWTLVKGFSFVGQIIRREDLPSVERFMVWTLGASLFAHVSTCISVSYFDQSFLFLYLNLALIGSAWSGHSMATATSAARATHSAARPLENRVARRVPMRPSTWSPVRSQPHLSRTDRCPS